MIKNIAFLASIVAFVVLDTNAMRPLIRCAPSRPSLTIPLARIFSDKPKTEQQRAWKSIADVFEKRVIYFENKQKEHESYAKMYGQLAAIEVEQFKNFHQTVGKLNEAARYPFEMPDYDAFDALENHRKALEEKKLELLQSLPNEDEISD